MSAFREEVEIHERVPLTKAQRRELLERQGYLCGCGCGASLRATINGEVMLAPMIDEHIKPLWGGGTNDLSNRAMWAVECSARKTRREATERAKVLRIRRRLAGEERPKQAIRSRGFARDSLSPRNFR
jgi:hypothetical protein